MKKLITTFLIITLAFAQSVAVNDVLNYDEIVKDINKGRFSSALKKVEKYEVLDENLVLLKIKSLRGLKRYEDALKIHSSFSRTFLNNDFLSLYYLEIGDIFADLQLYNFAFENYLKSNVLNNDRKNDNIIYKRLSSTLQLGLDYQFLHSLELMELNQDNLSLIYLAQCFSKDNSDNYLSIFPKINSSTFNRELKSAYKFIQKKISNNSDSYRIGVVLPLTGENSNEANAFLKGLTLSNNSSNSSYQKEFIVIDNYGSEIKTIEAFRVLRDIYKVSAVIGPFNEKNLLSAAALYSRSDTIILSPFYASEEVHKINKNVLLLNSSLKVKNQVLLNYLVKSFNDEDSFSIAIIAPDSDFGRKEVDSILIEMDQLNIEPISVQFYNINGDIDLRSNFDVLREIAWEKKNEEEYQDFLGAEIDMLDSMFEIETDDLYSRFNISEEAEIDSSKFILDTIDAVYLPVSNSEMKFVATQIALSNLDTQLIGNDLWFDMEFLRQENISPHIQKMIYSSTYSPNYKIRNDYGNNNSLNYFFYYGYDISEFLKSTLTISDLSSNSFEKGITRGFSFNLGSVNKSVNIYQFESNSLIKFSNNQNLNDN